jgi:hypothetical protein
MIDSDRDKPKGIGAELYGPRYRTSWAACAAEFDLMGGTMRPLDLKYGPIRYDTPSLIKDAYHET